MIFWRILGGIESKNWLKMDERLLLVENKNEIFSKDMPKIWYTSFSFEQKIMFYSGDSDIFEFLYELLNFVISVWILILT